MFTLLLPIIYAAFISLGLPDGLLGSAWPTMYPQFGVPVSYMGFVSVIIAMGTVVSSLKSDYLTKKLGVWLVTSVSVCMTAAAILGFAFTKNFWLLCALAVPYGLGAGSIDAALNNYVALHYKSHHMSWLHCMWGVGAALGPSIMAFSLNRQLGWNNGYLHVGLIQAALTLLLFASFPLWRQKTQKTTEDGDNLQKPKALGLFEVMKIPGVKAAMLMFFCYCALEQTAGQWAASFMVLARGISPEVAARFASLFYLGITVGRGICGFVTFKLNDRQMIKLGFVIILAGIILIAIPLPVFALAGLIITGLGCAPIFPSMIHSTPDNFGADKSQSVIGVQMASAYIGILFMPPLFGILTNLVGAAILPVYLGVFLVMMLVMVKKLPE